MNMNVQALKVYYDGSCPLCLAEIAAIRAVAPPEELVFTDCSANDFAEESALRAGIGRDAMMRELHAYDANGNWFRGVDAFVQLYRRAGLPEIARFWGSPVSRVVMKRLYPWIARNRYWLSRLGLPGLTESVVRFYAKRAQRRSQACADGSCSIGER